MNRFIIFFLIIGLTLSCAPVATLAAPSETTSPLKTSVPTKKITTQSSSISIPTTKQIASSSLDFQTTPLSKPSASLKSSAAKKPAKAAALMPPMPVPSTPPAPMPPTTPQIPLADATTINNLKNQASNIMTQAGTASGNFENQATLSKIRTKGMSIKRAAEIELDVKALLMRLPTSTYTAALWASHDAGANAATAETETMNFSNHMMRIRMLYQEAQNIHTTLSGGNITVQQATQFQQRLNQIGAEVNDLAVNKIPTAYNNALIAYNLAKNKISAFMSHASAGGYISSSIFWALAQTSANPTYMTTLNAYNQLKGLFNSLP